MGEELVRSTAHHPSLLTGLLTLNPEGLAAIGVFFMVTIGIVFARAIPEPRAAEKTL
jgi:hypothetical protein